MPEAPADVRALYRRHARGNSLFRNRGDGRFDDVTLEARAEMGRWAWSSDAFDFDSDGWEDLYVANGMLTRDAGPQDLDGFFWRQVVARSPLTRVTGTPYDDAWRAINQMLIRESIASRQRNVFLRNDGHGGFDDVSGSVGLDLDQDGRSFAVLDLDRDGDPDLALMAARQAPQLRLFRNDFAGRGALARASAWRHESNRDAIGARVTVETDRLRRTKVVQAGSGFLSQHSKELLFGLGAQPARAKLTIDWPSGRHEVFTRRAVSTAGFRLSKAASWRAEPFATRRRRAATGGSPRRASRGGPERDAGSTSPSRRRSSRSWISHGDRRDRSSALARKAGGRAAVAQRCRRLARGARGAGRGRDALTQAGVGALAVALDAPADLPQVRARRPAQSPPVVLATQELGMSFAILNRHVFMNRQDLPLPTRVPARRRRAGSSRCTATGGRAQIAAGRGEPSTPTAAERLARAMPFPGTLYSPPGMRNYLPYGRELLDQGLEPRRSSRSSAPRRRARAPRRSIAWARCSRRPASRPGRARRSSARWRCSRTSPRPATTSARCSRRKATSTAPSSASARRSRPTPDYPDALNNLGYALLLTGRETEARALYEKALALQPDFPEALNNLGLILGRPGDLDGRRGLLPRGARAAARLRRRREQPGARAGRAGRSRRRAVRLLETFSKTDPGVREHVRHARQDPPLGRADAPRPSPSSSGCCSAIPNPSWRSRSSGRFAEPVSDSTRHRPGVESGRSTIVRAGTVIGMQCLKHCTMQHLGDLRVAPARLPMSMKSD